LHRPTQGGHPERLPIVDRRRGSVAGVSAALRSPRSTLRMDVHAARPRRTPRKARASVVPPGGGRIGTEYVYEFLKRSTKLGARGRRRIYIASGFSSPYRRRRTYSCVRVSPNRRAAFDLFQSVWRSTFSIV